MMTTLLPSEEQDFYHRLIRPNYARPLTQAAAGLFNRMATGGVLVFLRPCACITSMPEKKFCL
jgi:hypothetical protein